MVRVVDEATGQPLAARLHLRDERGKPRRVKGHPFWHDHIVFDGEVTLELPKGHYTFEVEHGPEYVKRDGYFDIVDGANDSKTVELKRFVDMAAEGWWSGELHVHRDPDDIPLLMKADDLHVAEVITWWNEKNLWKSSPAPVEPWANAGDQRYYSLWAGEDERAGGALLYFGLRDPLPLPKTDLKSEFPPALRFAEAARKTEGVWIDAEKPFWWDFPVWVAAGVVDSVGIANNHMARDEMLGNEAWGRPRDKRRYPGARDNGRWTQDIYFHLLNCGLRIPPSAGSASGVLPNPVGYNRMYVHVGEKFSPETWFENFRAGRVIVTNGPMLRPVVSGAQPGYVFQSPDGQPVTLEISLNLATRDKISYLEVIKNGEVALSARLEDWAKTGQLPPVTFDHSGWMVIRAVTDVESTYRFAMTAPYYVEIGDQPRRISRHSVQFFLDWLAERRAKIKLSDAAQQAEVLKHHDAAKEFWEKRLAEANAD